MGKTIKKTNEEYLSQMKQLHPTIKVLGSYKNIDTKVNLECMICDYNWSATPYGSINSGYGCPKCATKLRAEEKVKKSAEKFKEKVNVKFPHIEIIGKYKKAKVPIELRCKTHNITFSCTPDSVSNSKFGCCPECRIDDTRKRFRISDEEILTRLKKIHPTLDVISEIKGTNYHSTIRCNVCNHQWESKLSNNIGVNKHGCPKCAGTLKKTTKEFIDEMKLVHGDEIVVIGEYKSNSHNIKLKCSKCNNEWESTPKNSLKGNGCPKCYGWKNEKKLMSMIEKYHSNLETQKKFNDLLGVGGNKLSYDGYLEFNGRKILIERQGHGHDRPIKYFGGVEKFKIQQEHDKRKRKYAEDNGYELIEIWYYDNPLEVLNKYGLCLENATLL